MAEDAPRRMELVAGVGPGRRESGRTGLGLLVGLFIGRSSLLAAASGAEQFEMAIAHFVAVVLICVGGALFIGNIYDRYASHVPIEDDTEDDSDIAPDHSELTAGTT